MANRTGPHSMWVGWWIQVLIVVISIPSVTRAIANPSPWRLTVLVVWVLLAASLCWTGYINLTGRRRPMIAMQRVEPTAVPFDDVVAAIEATPDRIEAIRELRGRHPGLGLKDAVHLVDEVSARPDL